MGGGPNIGMDMSGTTWYGSSTRFDFKCTSTASVVPEIYLNKISNEYHYLKLSKLLRSQQ